MSAQRTAAAFAMTLKMLVRSRLVLLLLFAVPALFYAVVAATTNDDPITFQLASLGAGEALVTVGKRREALVFIGLAATGLLTAFLAMNLAQKDAQASRRLVLCGYRPAELVAARLAVLSCVVVAVSCVVAGGLRVFFAPERLAGVVAGFALVGWVYGCYGLLVGSLLKNSLEGILLVALLANIDAGWLQNPLYYADAQNQAVIRALPAYFPSQVSMAAAFTSHAVWRPSLGALVYGAALLVAAAAAYAVTARRR